MLSLLMLVLKHNTVRFLMSDSSTGEIPHGPVVVLDGFGVTDVAIILCSYHGP